MMENNYRIKITLNFGKNRTYILENLGMTV